MTGSPTVTVRVESGIAHVTMSRAHANAIDGALVDDLSAALRAVEEDDAARAVILRGAGKLFCPGLDLQDLSALDRPSMQAFMDRFGAVVLELYTFPKPMLAALSGHALAGGLVLALAADWRVLRRGAMVGLNEVKVGVPLPYGVAHVVRESVPAHRRTEVALLGRNFRDEEALAAGVVDEIAEPDDFEARCLERAEEFASKDSRAFAVTKRYLRSAAAERARAQGRLLVPEWIDAWFSPSTRARVAEIVAGLKGKGK